MKYLVFTLSLLLTACSSTPPEAPIKKVQLTHIINHSLFEQVKTPSEHSIFELSEPEKSAFLTYAHSRLSNVRADEVIFNYLQNQLTNFKYDGATLTAQQSIERSEGNCISLAILTQSYAQLLNLETSFQEMTSEPVYAKEGNVIYVANHFRTKIYAPKKRNR